MAIIKVDKVRNGATRINKNGSFVYILSNGYTITVAGNIIEVKNNDRDISITIDYEKVDDRFSTTDAASYVEYLINNDFFFDDPIVDVETRLSNLENGTIQVGYFTEISIVGSTSGSISFPTGATLSTSWQDIDNAYLAVLGTNGTPLQEYPKDSQGNIITAELVDAGNGSGNWDTDGDTYPDRVGIVYLLVVSRIDYDNWTPAQKAGEIEINSYGIENVNAGVRLDRDISNPESPIISVDNVTDSEITANTNARHDEVTIGTANGLSINGSQQLSLALSTPTTSGAQSSADKSKLDNIDDNANDYVHPNHTGDVASIGDGVTTINDNVVDNAKSSDMPAQTIKGNDLLSIGDPKDLTVSEARALLSIDNVDNVQQYPLSNPSGFETPTQLDARDVANRDRSNHTGTQPASTITGLSGVAISGNHSDLNLNDGTNPHGTTQSDVGLSNVDNTSDLDKPISTATQSALDLKYDSSNPNGYETPSEIDTRINTNAQVVANTAKVSADGSINTHSDVDIVTTPIQSGDTLTWNGSSLVPQSTDNGFTIFGIWAEENGALTNNNRQWSFGNGAVGAINIVLPIDADLFAISFDAETSTGTASINIMQNDSVLITSNAFSQKDFQNLTTVQTFSSGQYIGFQTNTVVGAVTDARVCAWFRVRSSPASTSILNDLLDVDTSGILNNQILQYNGTVFSPIDLNTANVPESVNLYFTEQRVRDSLLTGLVTTNNSEILATDSVIEALGKIQAQITGVKEGYFEAIDTTGGQNLNLPAGVVVDFDTQNQIDSNYYSYNTALSLLTINVNGEYEFSFKINASAQTNARKNLIATIRRNGVNEEKTTTYEYYRQLNNPFGTITEAKVRLSVISGQTFDVFVAQAGDGGACNSLANQSYFNVKFIK